MIPLGARGKALPESRLARFREVDNMNTHALSRIVRSLYFRRRLATAIPTLEAEIKAELAVRGRTAALVDGFLVRYDGKNLVIQPTRRVHPGQLWLPWIREDLPTDASQDQSQFVRR